jgi:hypothetical protein
MSAASEGLMGTKVNVYSLPVRHGMGNRDALSRDRGSLQDGGQVQLSG